MIYMPKAKGTKEKFEKLEQIVTDLENTEADIDKALKLYKEGVAVVCGLSLELKDISKEVNILKEKMDGAFALTPFDEDDGDSDDDE